MRDKILGSREGSSDGGTVGAGWSKGTDYDDMHLSDSHWRD